MANRISTLFEFKESGNGLSKIRADVAQADGSINKFKTGASGAFDFVKANAAGLAASGGAAIVSFGIASAQAFVDTAVEAKNLAALTGDTVEQSSRLNAVWKQSGADAKDLQDVLLQMNGVLATNSGLAKQLGIDLNDGATVGQRFEEVADALDQIPDAARRSQIASQVFGEEGVRQYNALRGAVGDVGEAMANVSGSQVIDEAELRKAEELAVKMRELNAAVQGFVVAAGEAAVDGANFIKTVGTGLGRILSPWNENARKANAEVTDAFDASAKSAAEFDRELIKTATSAKEVWDTVKGLTGDVTAANIVSVEWAQTHAALQEELKQTTTAQDMVAESIAAASENVNRFGADGVENMGAVEDSADDTADAIDLLRKAYDKLLDKLSDRSAYLDVEQGFDDLAAAATTAFETATSGEGDAEQAARDHERAIIDLKERVIGYGDSIEGLPPERVTDILALIDEGKFAEAEAKLALLERQRQVNLLINPVLTAAMPTTADGRVRGGRARGGPVAPRSLYDVVENGDPELLHVGGRTLLMTGDQGGMVTPTGGASAGVSSGSGSGGGRGQVSVTTNNHYHRWQVFGSDDRLVQQVVRRMSMMNRGRL